MAFNPISFDRFRERLSYPEGTVPAQSEVDRQRNIAASLGQARQSAPPITHWLQGINQVAQSAVEGLTNRKASQGQELRQQAQTEALAGVIDWAGFGIDPNIGRQLLTLNPELGNALLGMQIEDQRAQQPEAYTLGPGQGRYVGDEQIAFNEPAPESQEIDRPLTAEERQSYGIPDDDPTPWVWRDGEVTPLSSSLLNQTINTGDQGAIPEGFKAVDQAFARDVYVPWLAAGGYADVEKNLNQLEEVFAQLEGGVNITGPIIGRTPDFFLSIFNPTALNARERVEEVVQRNLREVLGAQFTENEGVRLIARAFNPALDDELNAARLASLIQAIADSAQAKDEAVGYFRENGTLWGWEGTLPTVADFDAALDAAGTGDDAAAAPDGDITAADIRTTIEAWTAQGLTEEAAIEAIATQTGLTVEEVRARMGQP